VVRVVVKPGSARVYSGRRGGVTATHNGVDGGKKQAGFTARHGGPVASKTSIALPGSEEDWERLVTIEEMKR